MSRNSILNYQAALPLLQMEARAVLPHFIHTGTGFHFDAPAKPETPCAACRSIPEPIPDLTRYLGGVE